MSPDLIMLPARMLSPTLTGSAAPGSFPNSDVQHFATLEGSQQAAERAAGLHSGWRSSSPLMWASEKRVFLPTSRTKLRPKRKCRHDDRLHFHALVPETYTLRFPSERPGQFHLPVSPWRDRMSDAVEPVSPNRSRGS